MRINERLTDFERIELTKKSYEELAIGAEVVIGKNMLGKVAKIIHEEDGLRGYVISNQSEITILFKGSFGLRKGNPTTWRDEWLRTNLPILLALINKEAKIPSQLVSAARVLNQSLHELPGLPCYIYGHSLGAINAQYALAHCRHPERIAGAYLYEGTNIWELLNSAERRRVGKLRQRINNYIDIYDPVTLGFTATHHMVGRLCYVDSRQINPISQHMWGGYQFDANGKLRLKEVDEEFLRESRSEQRLLTKSNDLAKMLDSKDPTGEFRKLAVVKMQQLQDKLPSRKSLSKLASSLIEEKILKNKSEE